MRVQGVTPSDHSDPTGSAPSRTDISEVHKPHIFAFAPNSWQGPWMNRQQILSRLARRGWSVTYSTGPLSTWERRSERWRAAPWFNAYELHDGVQVEIAGKALPRWPRIGSYDRFVIRRNAAALLRQARGAPSESIAYVFHPSLYDLAAAMDCRRMVYHVYDIFSLQPEWSDDLAQAQDKLLQRADLVIASSPLVAEALHGAGRQDILTLPNGADAQAFEDGARRPCPADLAAIPRPRLSYIGHLNRKVDFAVIAATAKARPDWQWVLVGPVPTSGSAAPDSDPKIADAYRECRTLPNIHFLGSKPHTDLPAYAAHMDVNVICYRADRGWWNAASPLKLHEYLATGLPVVSIDLPGLNVFSEVVTFVDSTADWRGALETALSDRSPQAAEQRRRVARANSWDRRVDLLEQHFSSMVDDRASPAEAVQPAHAAR
jgi:glycosyltransferase involved in cell wall biosynthesis